MSKQVINVMLGDLCIATVKVDGATLVGVECYEGEVDLIGPAVVSIKHLEAWYENEEAPADATEV